MHYLKIIDVGVYFRHQEAEAKKNGFTLDRLCICLSMHELQLITDSG